jgi:hypothetical protein
MEKRRFELFCVKGPFEGFTTGDNWNGWACPYFTLEEGLRLVEAWKAPVEYSGLGPAWYDAGNDVFEFTIEDQTDSFGPEVVDGMKLYPIAAHGCCWEESE